MQLLAMYQLISFGHFSFSFRVHFLTQRYTVISSNLAFKGKGCSVLEMGKCGEGHGRRDWHLCYAKPDTRLWLVGCLDSQLKSVSLFFERTAIQATWYFLGGHCSSFNFLFKFSCWNNYSFRYSCKDGTERSCECLHPVPPGLHLPYQNPEVDGGVCV